MFAGIDTHKDTLAVAVIDQLGVPIHAGDYPNTRVGFVEIAGLLDRHRVSRVGIEGSGHYGRCVAAYLALDVDATWAVVEVPTLRTSRERASQPGRGKTDPRDALAIARITLRDDDLPLVRFAVGAAADLRSLLDYREDLVRQRTSLANQVHIELHGLFPGYHHQIATLIRRQHLDAAVELVRLDDRVRAEVTRRRLDRILAIDVEVAELKQQIAILVGHGATSLTSIYGIGPLIAARFLAEVADITRYPNRDAIASANGTAPIPASSGRTVRYRFNRGGNRRLNKCLYMVAITQIRADTLGRTYYRRKLEEGETSKEALRCLKRRLRRDLHDDEARPRGARRLGALTRGQASGLSRPLQVVDPMTSQPGHGNPGSRVGAADREATRSALDAGSERPTFTHRVDDNPTVDIEAHRRPDRLAWRHRVPRAGCL